MTRSALHGNRPPCQASPRHLQGRPWSTIGDLTRDAHGRDRTDEDDGSLDSLIGGPASLAFAQTLLGDSCHHLHGPVHGCHQVDLHDETEVLDRIDRGTSGLLVHLHGEPIACDACGRHADSRRSILAAQQVEGLLAEGRVGDVADDGLGDGTIHPVIDEPGNVDHAVAAINQPDRADASLGELDGDRLANTAGRARDDSAFSFDIHAGPSNAIRLEEKDL